MNSPLVRRLALLAVTALALAASTRVFAGPPLICHPYKIGAAPSLPAGSDRFGTSANYDRTHLVADTLARLQPDTAVLVRMETLRRAAIYASGNLRGWNGGKNSQADRDLATELTNRLRERTTDDASRAMALFDLGFFVETARQAGLGSALDGYGLLAKASRMLKGNPEVEFALALASSHPQRAEHAAHLAKARAAAQPGSPLAVNLEAHFGKS